MIDDPRAFPLTSNAGDDDRAVHAQAEASLAAATGEVGDASDARIRQEIAARLERGDGAALSRLLATSPSAAVYRHLWRALVSVWDTARPEDLPVSLFALPVVVVAAGDGDTERTIDAILPRPDGVVSILTVHGALGAGRQFAVGASLVAAESIGTAAMPSLAAAAGAFASGDAAAPLDLRPAPIVTARGHETVHLRFLVGTALGRGGAGAAPGPTVGPWGAPLAGELARQIARPGVTLTALPRAPQSLPVALVAGRAAAREVAAMLFTSQALRRIRSAVGEPVAIVSAHRCASAPAGGELRLSLSSPLEPREAEGFRCPLEPLDRVADVAAMLVDLLRDCRVADVRTLAGVHPDRDPSTGFTEFYKPETVPPGADPAVH